MFDTKTSTINVECMTCHHCEMTVENAVKQVNGVKDAKADRNAKKVEIKHKGELDMNAVRALIEEVGYKMV
jgi:copper chaperone CopZ